MQYLLFTFIFLILIGGMMFFVCIILNELYFSLAYYVVLDDVKKL